MGVRTVLGSTVLVAVVLTSCGDGGSTGADATTTGTITSPPPTSATATASPTPTTAAPTTTRPTTRPTTTTSTSTTTSTTAPAAEPEPVEDVVVAGDSLALGLFAPLQAALQTPERPVGFAWALVTLDDSKRVWERLFDEDRPDVVIVHFSVWENAVLRGNEIIDSREPGWQDVYRRDVVDPWIERALASESHVVWIGIPPMADAERWAQLRELDDVWRTAILEAAEQQRRQGATPSLQWVAIEQLFTTPDGGFTDVAPTGDPPDRWFNVDGLHWCPAGAALVSERVIAALGTSVNLGDDGLPTVPDWRSAPWANEPVAVPSAQGTFGDLQVAYPDGECPVP